MREIRVLSRDDFSFPAWSGIGFKCDETLCDRCKLKFKCYTSRDYHVYIVDKEFYHRLHEKYFTYGYSYEHAQRLARKAFFNEIIK